MKRDINWEKVKGITFLIVFVGSLIGFAVFMFLKMYLVGMGCFVLGVASWFIVALLAHIKNKKMQKEKGKPNYIKQTATVISCSVASERDRIKDYLISNSSKYRLVINYNEKKIVLYSNKVYKKDDIITIMVNTKAPKNYPNSIIIWQ